MYRGPEHASSAHAEALPRLGPVALPRRLTTALAAGALAASLAVGGFWAWNAGLFGGRMNAAEAAEIAAERLQQEVRIEHQAFTAAYLGQAAQEVRLGSGDTLARILTSAGATPADAAAAMQSMAGVFDPRRIRPGVPINVYFQEGDEGPARLSGLAFRSEPGMTITVNRLISGGFNARQVAMPLTYERTRIRASVDSSLHDAAVSRGATPGVIAQMADVFAFDVDFQRDVRPGDPFELVFDRYYDDEGVTVRTGELLYVSLTTRGNERAFYRFQAPGDRTPQWYNPDGESARRFLMMTPINGARLSSRFGMRRHPIQGYNRMHRGTDFAAPAGTPIMAAGDGVIQRAGRFGGYGNYIRIRHSSRYDTAYGHMSRFASGMRAGARVRQGQIIGYVGSTGASTGPHLHYEVFQNGRQINPMTMRVETGRNLAGRDLELFEAERARIDLLRLRRDQQAVTAEQAAAQAQPAAAPGATQGGLRR
ncbi:MAG: M23 family metallopeptidase [Hyphomonadaceae bacterium]